MAAKDHTRRVYIFTDGSSARKPECRDFHYFLSAIAYRAQAAVCRHAQERKQENHKQG